MPGSPPKSRFQAPLIYRMAAQVRPQRRQGIEELHRATMRVVRRYTVKSLAGLVHEHVTRRASREERMRGLPWIALLLLKWALQDGAVALYAGTAMPSRVFDALRQQLWDHPSIEHEDGSEFAIFRRLRALMNVQAEYQVGAVWEFVRWPALIERLPADHPLRDQFREAIGIGPSEYLELTTAVFAQVLKDDRQLPRDLFSVLANVYGASAQRFEELCVRDLTALRVEMQSTEAKAVSGKHELFEFPYLKRFPLFRLRSGEVVTWGREVCERGFADIVHLKMSARYGKGYVDPFSRVFESYVTELASLAGLPAVTEAEIKTHLGGHAPSVEAVLIGRSCNILVEAKMGIFADNAALADRQDWIFQRLKPLRGAIEQGRRVSALIRERPDVFGKAAQQPMDYLVVVTSRDLHIGTGCMFNRLVGLDPQDPRVEGARLPEERIMFVPIGDFERVVSCAASGAVDLDDLMSEMASKANSYAQAPLHLTSLIQVGPLPPLPPLIEGAKEATLSRLERRFTAASPTA